MCGNLGKGARCSNPNGNCDSRPALDALPHIAAEFGQIGPLGGLKPQKGFINGIRLHQRTALLKDADYPCGNIAVQSIIRGKYRHVQRAQLGTELEFRAPMGMPRALASAERDTMQPSLLESTTTGRLARSGRNSFSHEA